MCSLRLQFLIFVQCTVLLSVLAFILEESHEFAYQWIDSTQYRDELNIVNVVSEEDFDYGQNVTTWKSLFLNDKTYAVGVNKNGFTILKIAENPNGKFDVTFKSIDLEEQPIDLIILDKWNKTLKNYQIVIAIAFSKQLVWYTVSIDLDNIEQTWTWPILCEPTHLNAQKLDENHMLLLIACQTTSNSADLNLYKFSLHLQQFWLLQSIQLEQSPGSSAFNTLGPILFLSVAQTKLGKVITYIFKNDEYFVQFANISSENVASIVSFQQSFKTFLAIDGSEAGIYEINFHKRPTKNYDSNIQYNREKNLESEKTSMNIFQKQVVKFGILSEINFWFKIPVNTYRQDVILLAQKQVEHQSHSSQVIEVILYNGEDFEIHEEMTCNFYGELLHGMSCLAEEEHETGIKGSAVVSLGNYLGLLVPHERLPHSGLFRIETSMKNLPSPFELEMKKFEEQKRTIEEKLKLRELSKNVDPKLPEGNQNLDNKILEANLGAQIMQHNILEVVKDNPKVPKVLPRSQVTDQENAFSFAQRIKEITDDLNEDFDNKDQILRNTQNLNIKKTINDTLNEIEEKLLKVRSDLNAAKEVLKQAIPANTNLLTLNQITINGNLEITGKAIIKEIKSDFINGHNWTEFTADLFRHNKSSNLQGNTIFSNAFIDHIKFQTVNGISYEDLIYSDEFSTGSDVFTKGSNISTGFSKKPLIINGDITFETPVQIQDLLSNKINNMVFLDEIIEIGSYHNISLDFRNITILDKIETHLVNNFVIHDNYTKSQEIYKDSNNHTTLKLENFYHAGSIFAKEINGEVLDQNFVNNIYKYNEENHVKDHAVIDSKTLVTGAADINELNGLPFPAGYLFPNSNSFITVTGVKQFTKDLNIAELMVEGFINGIKVDSIITTKTDQTLPGVFKIKDLEISESLIVKGEISGPSVRNYLPNPTLLGVKKGILTDRKIISNLNFQEELEIDGDLIIEDLNGKNFEEILNNVVLKNSSQVIIKSPKTFPKGFGIQNGLYLESNAINETPIGKFVTTNTNQILEMKTLNGNVEINNLILSGLIGDKNITKLEEETVRTNGDQYVQGTFTFSGEVQAENLLVTNSINGVPVKDVLFVNQDLNFINTVEFDELIIEDLEVAGNLNSKKSNFDEFWQNGLDSSLDNSLDTFGENLLDVRFGRFLDVIQNDLSPKHLSATSYNNFLETLGQKIQPKFINGIPYEELFNQDYFTRKIGDKVLAGKIKIKNLQVEGSINAETINDYEAINLLQGCNQKVLQHDHLEISGNATFDNLVFKVMNGFDVNEYFQNVVYKNETDVLFKSMKVFEKGIHVQSFIETEYLNNIRLPDVLTKYKKQKIRAPLIYKGDVRVISDTTIQGELNGVDLNNLDDIYDHSENLYTIKTSANISFQNVQIQNLQLKGFANGMDLQELLENVVQLPTKNSNLGQNNLEPIEIHAPCVFKEKVLIDENLGISETLDQVDLSTFQENVVLTSQDAFIDGSVTFQEEVQVSDNVFLRSNLITERLMNIDLENWKKNAVYTNKGKIPGHVTFESVICHDKVKVDFINGINTKNFAPLKSALILDEDVEVRIMDAVNDIEVKGDVNKMTEIKAMYDNTVRVDSENVVITPIEFTSNVVVRDWIKFGENGSLNEEGFSKIVWVESDEELKSRYNFISGRTLMQRNLEIEGLINGVELNSWYNKAIRISQSQNMTQNIDQVWNVTKSVTFDEDVQSTGLIADIDVRILEDSVKEMKNFKSDVEEVMSSEYKTVCQDVKNLMNYAKNQVYIFKNFESFQTIKLDGLARKIYNLDLNYNSSLNSGSALILVQVENSCYSTIYIWSADEKSFVLLQNIKTGVLDQIVSTRVNNEYFLVTRSDHSDETCNIAGTIVWKITSRGKSVVRIYQIEDLPTLQESVKPGTFYGKTSESVMEFQIQTDPRVNIKRIRKWYKSNSDKHRFVARYLKTGLALTDGFKLYKLGKGAFEIYHRGNSEDTSSYQEEIIIGNITEVTDREFLLHTLSLLQEDATVMKVGSEKQKELVAITSKEDIRVKSRSDVIKIFESLRQRKIFQKLLTYKPSSLLSLEFKNNPETLLLFLENQKSVQVYEYKGIEGFRFKSSMKLEASQLFKMKVNSRRVKMNSNRLPVNSEGVERNFVGLLNKNKIVILEAKMAGHQLAMEDEQFSCHLN